jgi:hypothetical protein
MYWLLIKAREKATCYLPDRENVCEWIGDDFCPEMIVHHSARCPQMSINGILTGFVS